MKHHRSSHMNLLFTCIVVLSLMLTGCSGGKQVAGVDAQPSATTAAPTDTPAPTETATPVPTDTPTSTPTVVPTATIDRKATQAAKATATQEAINEMVAGELAKYEVDPSLGHVEWVMDEPVIMGNEDYAMSWYQEIEEIGVVKDFVFQTEITWDTSGGLAGCGYFFRAPDDWDLEIGNFYSLEMIRLQYDPRWFVVYYEDGRPQYGLPSNNGASSASIEDEKMSKNILTLHAKGSTFTVYINGTKQQVVENNKVTEGGIALLVTQNSGTSYCEFDKGWLWVYDN